MSVPKSWKTCSFCSRQVYKLANPSRGLCAACYYREKRNGDLAYKPERTRPVCKSPGCTNPNAAQGYCTLHYSRLRRHGVTEHARFDKWGHRDKHPLANSYYHMRRNYRGEVEEAWLFDFWKFVEDIGDRPSEKHRLRRIDPALPYRKDNVEWQPPKLDIPVTSREQANEYARAYRAANPDVYREQHLQRKFGVSLDWYKARLLEQGGTCAICREPEAATHQKTGLPREYAVDHCHKTGVVRALLCSKCNTGLGSFRDDPALLRAAASYLETHSKVA